MAKFDTIDARIRHCATGTDLDYGKCVLHNLPVGDQGNPDMPPLASKYIGKQSGQLITHDVHGNLIVGGTGIRRGAKKCVPSDKTKPLRPCHVELDVPTAEDQAELGLPAMPVLRLCSVKGGAGTLVSVSTPESALAAVNKFCNCSGPNAKVTVRKKCARSADGTRLGGLDEPEEIS
jgi:hypothetical protein